MIERFLSPAGAEIYTALKNAAEWDIDQGNYRIRHNPTGVTLWIANGAWFFDVRVEKKSPFDEDVRVLGLFERHILWRRVKRLLSARKQNHNKIIAEKMKVKNDK